VSTAEWECGKGLQTKEHIFWDCELCEDQKATMMEFVSENSNKGYPTSVTELLKLKKKYLYKASVNLETKLLDLSK
jgi:hypothetical protein